MSIRALARAARTSPQTISLVEAGRTIAPRASKLKAIASALEVSPEDLLALIEPIGEGSVALAIPAAPLNIEQLPDARIVIHPPHRLRLSQSELAALARRLALEFDLLHEHLLRQKSSGSDGANA